MPNYKEEMNALSSRLIRDALIEANGSFRTAAISLGLDQAMLSHILESRHSGLRARLNNEHNWWPLTLADDERLRRTAPRRFQGNVVDITSRLGS